MEISPAVPAPRAGDPITAKWAADLAAAVNSAANPADRVGEVSTPFGKASPAPGIPMLGTSKMPMPFDCAIFRPEGESEDSIYIWLPDGGAEYVSYNCNPVGPASGQDVGDSDSAWVEIGSVENDETRYVYLKFHADADGNVDGWEIEDTDTPWNPQDGEGGEGEEGCASPPQILIAAYNIAPDSQAPEAGTDNKFPSGKSGLVQYHHGTIEVTCSCGPECPDVYSVTKETGTLPECVAERYVFKRQHREIDPETGECVDSTGTGSSETTNIDVPKPPEYSLSVSGTCQKTVALYKTPCGGSASQAGDALTIDVPPTISASATGSTSGGEKAGTIYVTPCGGSATTIDIYNGKDGCSPEISASATGSSGGSLAGTIYVTPCGGTQIPINVYNGCSPEISAATPPTSHGSAAYTITPCGSGASPITVYHGRDGESGSLCGSVDIVVGIRVGTGTGGGTFLQINKVTHTFQKRTGSDCYELVPGADNWVDTNVEFKPCT
ncbi:MAG: hypothetical protein IIZ06_00275 [Kiritimatiellae bacterium]|nr:hypothetical protein [Kiritimatiellia bacterium]